MENYSSDVLKEMYRRLILIREFEEQIRKAYYEEKLPIFNIAAGPVPGEMHISAGQEPAAVGMGINLRKDDAVVATHRAHHAAIAKGVDLKSLAAEIFGKETGLGKGKGGHMHLFDTSVNFSCSGIVGASFPQATGWALAFKMLGKDSVAVAFGGEGAANQGTFHESMNLASLWKLPVVFVIEDNSYAISVPKSKSTSIARNSDRASAYGVPGVYVKDNDLIAMYEASREAVERARRGEGPSLIEIETYRFYGHFEGDPQAYRPAGEIDELRKKDPLLRVKDELEKRGYLTDNDAQAIEQEAKKEVSEAIDYAKNSPYPSHDEAFTDVFANYDHAKPDVGLPQGTRLLPMYKAISEGLAIEMSKDSRIFVMGEDIGKYGGIWGETGGLLDQFGPERVRDTPISESAFLGSAVGAAAAGLKPVVDLMFIDFIGVTYDQFFNHLAKNRYMSGGKVNQPVIVMAGMGGGYSDAAQHSQVLYAIAAHIPGMKVVVPSNAYDAKGLMISALNGQDPVLYLFHKGTTGLPWMPYPKTSLTHVPEGEYTVPLGSARIVKEGNDVTVVTAGLMVHRALEAAERSGSSVEVIDLRSLVPLDTSTIIESVKKTGRLIVVDEDYMKYGMTGEVIAAAMEGAFSYMKTKPVRVANPDVPVPYSRPLEQSVIPSVEAIEQAIRGINSK